MVRKIVRLCIRVALPAILPVIAGALFTNVVSELVAGFFRR